MEKLCQCPNRAQILFYPIDYILFLKVLKNFMHNIFIKWEKALATASLKN